MKRISRRVAAPVRRRGRGLAMAAAAALLVALLPAPPARSAAGQLDASFDGDGRLRTNVGTAPGAGSVEAVAIQTDGKIVAAGTNRGDFAVARYNSNGTLDTTFGDGGVVNTNLGDREEVADAVLQPDGKIVVAGRREGFGFALTESDIALARYNPDGSLDGTFGAGGTLTMDLSGPGDGGLDFANGVAVQTDGRIVVAGGSRQEFLLARLTDRGRPDTSFGGDGFVTTDFTPGKTDFATDVAVRASNGTIVAAGYSRGVNDTDDFAVARYLPDGSLDSSFSADGKTTSGFGGFERADAVALGSSGRVIVAGGTDTAEDLDFALARFTSTGVLDTSFSGDGHATVDIGTDDWAFDVAVDASGRVVVAGRTVLVRDPNDGPQLDFGLVRLTSAGVLDTSFAGDGITATDFGGGADDSAMALAIQSNGRIVSGGVSVTPFAVFTPRSTRFALARHTSAGALDTSFDGNGILVTLPDGLSEDFGSAMAVGSGGKLFVAGGTDAHDGDDKLAVARYRADGRRDTSFGGGDGIATADVPPATDLAVQAGGKLVVAGTWSPTLGDSDFAAARLNRDGSPDTGFAGGGAAIVDIGVDSFDFASAVAVQGDGKVIVAGRTRKSGSDDFALVRFTSTGQLDTTFGGDGKVTTSIGEGLGDRVRALALQADGKIVAAGSSGADAAVVRYLPGTGSLDLGFGENGIALADLGGGSDEATDVAIDPASQAIVATGGTFATDRDFAVVRFTGAGALDVAFGGDGVVVTDLGGDDTAEAVAILAGRAIVAGTTTTDDFVEEVAVVRFKRSGGRDGSFGGDGIVTTDLGSKGDEAGRDVGVLPDTRIVVVGLSGADLAAARYRGDPLPRTRITASEIRPRRNEATFRFGAVSGLSPYSFKCRLDGSGYRRCDSPETYRRLTEGAHIFRVRAIDAAGRRDPTPARMEFRV